MDLRQLQTLLVVAQVGSLKKAAVRLRIVETALSRQIRLLEAELRTPLFQRHGRGLTPTDAGRHLVDRAQPILAALEQLKAEMLSLRNAVSGKVAIGIPWLLLDTLSARLATGFIPRHPAVNIRFVGGVSDHLRQMLSAGDLDVALLFDPKPTRELALTPLFSERLLLVGDRACGYRLDRPLPFSHLAGVPLALADPGDPFRQHLEGVARGHGLTLNVRFEVAALQALKALAAKGLAQVFASLHAVRADLETGMLTAAPVDDPAITRTLVLALPEERAHSPALQHLAAAVRDEVAMLVADGSFLTCEA
ncbi:MAG: LysR family transcriptional regulator [Reyranella sp.]|nr:LysR family transcriptional regulator [Reyranella sp.]